MDQLIPKQETGAWQLGRSIMDTSNDTHTIRIGILDTGVDPALHNNKRLNLVNVMDCTGSGDVDVSLETTATLQDDGYYTVQALSGRTLRLPKDWTMVAFPDEDSTSTTSNSTTKNDSEKDDSTTTTVPIYTSPSYPGTTIIFRPQSELRRRCR